jgi:hypothetical protein
MDALSIDWYRVERGGDTCERCVTTGDRLHALVDDLADDLALSNAVSLDGRPLTDLVDADELRTDCDSRADPLDRPGADCRALEADGERHDAVPRSLLREAAVACEPDCCDAGV